MEETTPSPEYIRGFNEGYLLEKELPELAAKLVSVKASSDRIHGFEDGRRQSVIEKAKEQRPNKVKERPISKDQKFKDLDKDMDR